MIWQEGYVQGMLALGLGFVLGLAAAGSFIDSAIGGWPWSYALPCIGLSLGFSYLCARLFAMAARLK